ncbi:hypothetical protein D3C84_662060 [compost metagenome]
MLLRLRFTCNQEHGPGFRPGLSLSPSSPTGGDEACLGRSRILYSHAAQEEVQQTLLRALPRLLVAAEHQKAVSTGAEVDQVQGSVLGVASAELAMALQLVQVVP